MPHPLERELADQLVEERFGQQLSELRCDLAEALAANENLTTENAMLRDHRDRLQALLQGLRDAADPSPLGAVPDIPRTGLTVHPGGLIA